LEFPEFVAERSVGQPVAIKEIKISPHTLPMVISTIKTMKSCSNCNEVLHNYIDAVKTSSGNIWVCVNVQTIMQIIRVLLTF
jgi:hypothetical protein